jgi:hypothetical protein
VIVRIANLAKGRLNESGKVYIGMDVHQATISAAVMKCAWQAITLTMWKKGQFSTPNSCSGFRFAAG